MALRQIAALRGVSLRTFSLVLVNFLLLPCLSLSAQNIDATKVATVHVYRQGRLSVGIPFKIDGNKVGSLSLHKILTFYVAPGYHEITIRFGPNSPTAAFMAEAGQDYFFQMDYEHTMSMLSPISLSITLTQQQGIADREKLQEQKIDAKKLNEILAMSNPQGLEPRNTQAHNQPSGPLELMSDAEVRAAVLQGKHDGSPSMIGLYLNDVQTNVLSHALTPEQATNGFSIIIYTPSRWVEYQAALAMRMMAPFEFENVTPEMKSRVLHVVALPNTPDRLNGLNMSAATSVGRVVVCDKDKKTTVQPLTGDATSVTLDSALRSKDYTSIASTFDLREIDTVRGESKTDEFFVVVIGENGARKFFKVKQKFQNWL
jgi:hypothetical protein